MSKKKFRQIYNLFVAEGVKIIYEIAKSRYKIEKIFTTEELENLPGITQIIVNEQQLKKISFFTTPASALAVCTIPKENRITEQKGLMLALDAVRDPGNMGTIIRIADWFGIENIVCSNDCVDLYNPKVIQASMGSFTRVNVQFLDLASFLSQYEHLIYGTFMNGENIYETELATEGVIVMGNEANGINPVIKNLINKRISIPRFGHFQETESLNVAVATGIILSEFFSKKF